MTRPTAPPDPSSTVVDDDVEESKTGEMSPVSTETTATVLSPVPSTDATFVELAPTAQPPPQQTSVSASDTALPPIDPPRPPGMTMTTESEPDPLAQFRAWLRVPRFRNQRIFAAGGIGLLLVSFGMLLGKRSGPPDPGAARPIARAAPRIEPTPPKEPIVLDAPTALQAAAPIWLERAVDAGEGTTRMEKVEAGMIKIHSIPDTEVVMNGERLGPVPVFITAPVGTLDLVLESRDAGIYKPIAVPLYSGKNPGRMFELGRGWLEVVAPRGSQVFVNGRAIGAAPVPQLELYEGVHRLEVVRPDKSRTSKSVEVVPRFTTTHEISNP